MCVVSLRMALLTPHYQPALDEARSHWNVLKAKASRAEVAIVKIANIGLDFIQKDKGNKKAPIHFSLTFGKSILRLKVEKRPKSKGIALK